MSSYYSPRLYRLSLVWSICCWLTFFLSFALPISRRLLFTFPMKNKIEKFLPRGNWSGANRLAKWKKRRDDVNGRWEKIGRETMDWSVLAPCRDELGSGLVWIDFGQTVPLFVYSNFFFSLLFSFPLETKYKSRFQFSDSCPLFLPSPGPYGIYTPSWMSTPTVSALLRSTCPSRSSFFFRPSFWLCFACSPVTTRLALVVVTCICWVASPLVVCSSGYDAMFHAEETGWDLALLFKRKGEKGKEDVLRVAQKVTSTNPLPNARDLQRHLFGNSRSTGEERERKKNSFHFPPC